MRLLIYFYIVLGLFKLFKGLTHGIHSNSACRAGRGKPKSMIFLVEVVELAKAGPAGAVPGCGGGDCGNTVGQTPTVCFILF